MNILARGGIEFLAVLLGITISLWVDENSKKKDIQLSLKNDLINIKADLENDLAEIDRIDSLKSLGIEQINEYHKIINGTIKELLGWTACSALDFSNTDNPENELQIVVSGSRFVLVVNDEWVADIVDETIRSNGVGIAAQNYNEREQCLIKFSKIKLDVKTSDSDFN